MTNGRWVPVEILAAEQAKSIGSIKMQAIIAGRWDSKTWKIWVP